MSEIKLPDCYTFPFHLVEVDGFNYIVDSNNNKCLGCKTDKRYAEQILYKINGTPSSWYHHHKIRQKTNIAINHGPVILSDVSWRWIQAFDDATEIQDQFLEWTLHCLNEDVHDTKPTTVEELTINKLDKEKEEKEAVNE